MFSKEGKESSSFHKALLYCQVHQELFAFSCSKNFLCSSQHQHSRPGNQFPWGQELALKLISVIQVAYHQAVCWLPTDVAKGSPDLPSFPWQLSCLVFRGLMLPWSTQYLQSGCVREGYFSKLTLLYCLPIKSQNVLCIGFSPRGGNRTYSRLPVIWQFEIMHLSSLERNNKSILFHTESCSTMIYKKGCKIWFIYGWKYWSWSELHLKVTSSACKTH